MMKTCLSRAPRSFKMSFLFAVALAASPSAAQAASGDIETIAGTGVAGSSGDGGAATAATLRAPSRIVIEAATGAMFLADTTNHKIRKIDSSGVITTFAGTGTAGFSGDSGQATAAKLSSPRGLAFDGSGRLVIADTANNRIRRIESNGTISTIVGTGVAGSTGDGSAATAARVSDPWGVAYDSSGALFIADHGSDKIRRVDAAGVISTVAGTGTVGLSGDGGLATAARLSHPGGVAIDLTGRLLVVDKGNDRIRRVELDGIINTIAGSTGGDAGDGGAATSAKLSAPQDVTVSPIGAIYIADSGNHRVRRIGLDGIIETAAGTGIAGYSGDGASASLAKLRQPSGVAIAPSGALLIIEDGNHVVRRVTNLCGDGIADVGEQCDLGALNGVPIGCCSATCTLRAAGEVCRGSGGSCDIAETCTGASATCPSEAVVAAGTPCRASTGICDPGEICTGAAAACPIDSLSAAGTVCRAGLDSCDSSEVCSGSTGDCPADALAAAGAVCRAAAGGCDVVETCSGTTVSCPADGLVTAGTVCRGSGGSCDVVETCSGASATCPSEVVVTAGTLCRASTGICDPAEICSGAAAACPGDSLSNAGTVCRAGVDMCDTSEVCTGSTGTCPTDGLVAAGTVCRAAAGGCDVVETCSGASVSCPADGLVASGSVCRGSSGSCDVVETCSGSAAACPVEVVLAVGTLCRASAGGCDPQETCSGAAGACPVDTLSTAGTVCRNALDICDISETCSGNAAACPTDAMVAAGQICRASAGICDVDEKCSGSAVSCPSNTMVAAATVCRGSDGVCDPAETCTGGAAACPTDAQASSSTVCRSSIGACDPQETCTGSQDACPTDSFTPDADSDEVCDPDDNCQIIPNLAQEDVDTDGVGDICDNCPSACNPDQTDSDDDIAGGDACDACPALNQAATPSACGWAAQDSSLSCCLPLSSAAQAADEEGDVCGDGGTFLLASSDGRTRLRAGAGTVGGLTTISATALTRGLAAAELGGPAGIFAAASVLLPENESFANPLTVCLGVKDNDDDGVVDGDGPRTADLQLLAAPEGGALERLSPRCADMPCGAIDADGFPDGGASFDAWGGGAAQLVCCDIERGAICFQAEQGGTVALGAPLCTDGLGSLKVTQLGQGANQQKFQLKGEASLAHPLDPEIDPVADGLHLRVLDRDGRNIFSVSIPAGSFDRSTGRGWSVSGKGGSASWKSKIPVEGLDQVKLGWNNARDPGLVSFQVKGKDLSFEVSDDQLPLRVELAFGPEASFEGQCGALDFSESWMRGCFRNPSSGLLLCR